MTLTPLDRFGEKAESIPTPKFEVPGDVHTGTIVEIQFDVQGVDYDTKLPAVWDGGKPKTHMVITLDEGSGVTSALWALYWNDGATGVKLYREIAAAAKRSGESLEVGGTLSVKFTHKDGNAKAYKAHYEPPTVRPKPKSPVDRFGDTTEAPPF